MTTVQTTREKNTAARTSSKGFSTDEQAAMKDRAAEVKAAARRGRGQEKAAADEHDLLAKIADMSEPDRALAERLHTLITQAGPDLDPKLWYGMPAYARQGKIVCFFQAREKFKTRYAILGFNDEANLDNGAMWSASYALTALGDSEDAAITALITRAVS